jgi:alkylation response protein AidB-like acyl-CoA dehydrogenase
VTGEKMWISFGDHPLTERIGHMVLARTPDAPAGSSGLSLFLVPNIIDGRSNGVFVRRIEEKLGLHGSPTCEMGFEQAQGWLIGTLNRGLSAFHDDNWHAPFSRQSGSRNCRCRSGIGLAL